MYVLKYEKYQEKRTMNPKNQNENVHNGKLVEVDLTGFEEDGSESD